MEKKGGMEDVDRDILCPICIQIIEDAFMASCGHSFCYTCIVKHLQNKSDCPSCSQFITKNHVYPNFLLNKLLTKTSTRLVAQTATPLEQFSKALEQGYEMSVKDLDSLLHVIAEKKTKMEQDEAETNLQILQDFLVFLKKKKLGELNEIQSDLQHIKEDIHAVEKHRIEFYRRRDRYSSKMRMLSDDPTSKSLWPSSIDKHTDATVYRTASVPDLARNQKADLKPSAGPFVPSKGASGASDNQNLSQSALALERKRRVHAQFNDLQDCYLQKRRYWARVSSIQQERDSHGATREGYTEGLEDFQSVLSNFTRYSRLQVVAELRNSAKIVSSIEFDRDDELFATAGVSRQINIFEFSSVINEPADFQCPVTEMFTRSKLSCLSWNKCTKNHIASSDYEGTVTIWDVITRQSVMEYEEHEKRAWSVDFSPTEPSMLVSGSDDCKVKVWCTKQKASVLNIDMKANICSVKYNPGSNTHIAVGCADHHIYYYDLRNLNQPLHIFSGHRKAVSYVKFLSNNELASASIDNTLRLWDVKEDFLLRTYRGHANEKNFVGLTVNRDYLACGSETNEVFVYHKVVSRPAARHRFVSFGSHDEEDIVSSFISAMCWKGDSPTLLAADSCGAIKVLVLVP